MTCAPAYGLGTSKNPTQIMTCAPAYGLGTSKKKKPYADYDLCPQPMAWAQVISSVCPRPKGFGGLGYLFSEVD